MARFYPQTSPALRIVDANGAPIFGPHHIGALGGAGFQNGLWASGTRVRYVPLVLGPVTYATWDEAPITLGYRPEVEITFALIEFDQSFATGAFGYGLLEYYYNIAMSQSAWAPLQFNLYASVTNIWRGMYPTTPFNPEPAQGKETAGVELTLGLKARSLLTGIPPASNAWETYQW